MEIGPVGAQVDLAGGDPLAGDGQRWILRTVHAAIGRDHEVAGEPLPLLLQEGGHAGAADLLLALHEELKVDRRRAAGADQRLQRSQRREDVPLVVGGAAGIDAAVPDLRREGGRLPEIEGIGRLDIVVPVDQRRGLVVRDVPVTVDDRVAPGRQERHLRHPRLAQPLGDPVRRPRHVCIVRRQGADARDAQELAEIVDQPLLMLC